MISKEEQDALIAFVKTRIQQTEAPPQAETPSLAAVYAGLAQRMFDHLGLEARPAEVKVNETGNGYDVQFALRAPTPEVIRLLVATGATVHLDDAGPLFRHAAVEGHHARREADRLGMDLAAVLEAMGPVARPIVFNGTIDVQVFPWHYPRPPKGKHGRRTTAREHRSARRRQIQLARRGVR